MPPDGFFFDDLLKNRIRVFQDTSILCDHYNIDWAENPDWANVGQKEKNAELITVV